MGGKIDKITRGQGTGCRFALDLNPGCPLQNDDPFVIVLIVPFARRGRLVMGHDPFDAQAIPGEQDLENFTPCRVG